MGNTYSAAKSALPTSYSKVRGRARELLRLQAAATPMLADIRINLPLRSISRVTEVSRCI
jgi:hypothetical protein